MSSMTKSGDGKGGRDAVAAAGGEAPGSCPMELTERQVRLEGLWAHYKATCYDHCAVDWDGAPAVGKLERQSLMASRSIPPGFEDVGGDTMPLKYRRPTAPAYLCRSIVKRFTGLLFSTKRRPRAKAAGDEASTEWLDAFIRATRFWHRWILARDYGGAVGSVAVGFKFVGGRPQVEVHDPRWCRPTLRDRDTGELARLEKKYMYEEEVRGPDGRMRPAWFWYRRVISRERDEVWSRVPADEFEPGREPDWRAVPSESVQHNLGFCPVVWVQNEPCQDDVDGDCDCEGAFDLITAADGLLAQAHRGTLKNADPTTVVSTSAQMAEVRKGSDNAIKLPDGSASYLEMTGSGVKAAEDLADKLEGRALRLARCVLDDNFDGPARTEEEVRSNYSAMLERADVFREQYGQAAQALLEMACRAAATMDAGVVRRRRSDGLPEIVRGQVVLPGYSGPAPKADVVVELSWPDYIEAGPQGVSTAVDAAVKAKDGGLIDRHSATAYVARHFGVEDPQAMADQLDAEEAERSEAMMQQMTGGADPSGEDDQQGAEPDPLDTLDSVDTEEAS